MTDNYPDNDLDIALMFFEDMEADLVLIMMNHSQLPFVRRRLYKTLGTPDNTRGDVFKYGVRRIHLLLESDENAMSKWDKDTILFKIESWETI